MVSIVISESATNVLATMRPAVVRLSELSGRDASQELPDCEDTETFRFVRLEAMPCMPILWLVRNSYAERAL